MDEPRSPRTFKAYDWSLRTPSPRRSTPKTSPCQYSDRLIPSRAATDLETGLTLLDDENMRTPNTGAASSADYPNGPGPNESENNAAFERLLRTGLLKQTSPVKETQAEKHERLNRTPEGRGLFRYKSAQDNPFEDLAPPLVPPLPFRMGPAAETPPPKPPRKIAQEPFRVLHAPRLEDDFYSNPLDCSSSDVLAVGLSACVDLFCSRTGQATRLADVGGSGNAATAVSWAPSSNHLAIGTVLGEVQIWDASAGRRVRSLTGHRRRVAALSWNGSTLATGSKDCDILLSDFRQPEQFHSRLRGHGQEVCGLKWSPDGQQLASGGNEGNVFVWNQNITTPQFRFCEHEAAVKALAWSPHKRGLLASGGGTADKCLRMWNTATGSLLANVCTFSQVCCLAWSKNTDEIVSTHGYSGNEVILWKYPSLSRVATLTGHTARVLHLTSSADGQNIITGAGDETIRFWNVFPACSKPRASAAPSGSSSGLNSLNSRTIR